MTEIWEKAFGLEKHYEVSNLGNIRSLPRITTGIRKDGSLSTQRRPGKIISPYVSKQGYLTVALKIDGVRKKYLLHRLVAATFVSGYSKELTVNHINGIKTDNTAENLEWVTLEENTRLQWKTGLVDLRGEKHPLSKISNTEALRIKNLSGRSVTDIAEEFGISTSLVYKIRQGIKRRC